MMKNEHRCLYPGEILKMQQDVAILKTEMIEVKCDVREIKTDIKGLIEKLDNRYVLRSEWTSLNDKVSINQGNIQKLMEWVSKYGTLTALVIYFVLKGVGLAP